MRVLFAIIVTSCAGSGRSDDELYLDVVSHPDRAPSDAWDLCERIDDPALAGDCALAVADRAARATGTPLEEHCDKVPDGMWRGECLFQASEVARRQRDFGRAAELCARSGPFATDCGQHMWETPLREIAKGAGRDRQLVRGLLPARQLYDRYAPLLAEHTDIEERFWYKYYSGAFQLGQWLDLSACDELPDDHPQRCVDAALRLYEEQIGPRIEGGPQVQEFCAMESPSSADIQRWFPATPDPRLDDVLRKRHAVICRKGE